MHTDTIANKKEVPSLKKREVSKKADSLLTTGTKKANPNKLKKKQNCQSDEFVECMRCCYLWSIYCI